MSFKNHFRKVLKESLSPYDLVGMPFKNTSVSSTMSTLYDELTQSGGRQEGSKLKIPKEELNSLQFIRNVEDLKKSMKR